MSVAFHRLIMPDGYSVDLDQFHGLDQIGEEGLKDKVNNHYLQIFGATIALGVIAGAAEISQGGGVYRGLRSSSVHERSCVVSIAVRYDRSGPLHADSSTITIREGHRVKVYITQDMLLPAYENHTIPDPSRSFHAPFRSSLRSSALSMFPCRL